MMNYFIQIILPVTLLSPFLGVILIWLTPSYSLTKLRYLSLFVSLGIFILSLLLYYFLDLSNISFQFLIKSMIISELNFSFSAGLDGISVGFIILTAFLQPLCVISSWENIRFRIKEFLILLFLVEAFLFQVFSTLDLTLFYIFFEAVLIPMFLIIGIWGSRTRKIHAAYQFFLYTFFGSVLILLAILFLSTNLGSTNYLVLLQNEFTLTTECVLWLAFFLSFAIKIPMVPLHIWLPEAHVEAPTAGSVLLAGILLKLGTYGFIRFSLPLFPQASYFFTPLIFIISLVAIIYASLTTLRQVDLKKIIAYTSIAHINLVTVGLFSNSSFGLIGALALILSHGLVSSGLFLCVGILYDRYHTRLIRYYGGIINLIPVYGLLFLILSLANMGLPGTSAFPGEFIILLGAFVSNTFVSFISAVSIILSGAYSIWFYNRIIFGRISQSIKIFADLNYREFIYMAILTMIVIYFGIYPNSILDIFQGSVSIILYCINNN